MMCCVCVFFHLFVAMDEVPNRSVKEVDEVECCERFDFCNTS